MKSGSLRICGSVYDRYQSVSWKGISDAAKEPTLPSQT